MIFLKNDCIIAYRRVLELIRNYKSFLICAVVMIIFLLPEVFSMYSANLQLIENYASYIIFYVIMINFLYGFFGSKSRVKLHHADIYYFTENSLKKKMLIARIMPRIVMNLLVAILMGIILYAKLDIIVLNYIIIIWLFLNNTFLYSFYRYHKNIGTKIQVSYAFFTILMIFVHFRYDVTVSVLLISIILNVILYYIIMRVKINREKIFKEMCEFDRMQFAARSSDLCEMQVIQSEYSSIKRKKFTYCKILNRKNAIIQKIILSIRRTESSTLIILLSCYIFTISINYIYLKVDAFYVIILAVTLINIIEILIKQMKNLILKEKSSLYLRYSRNEIALGHAKINLAIASLLFLIMMFIMEHSVWNFIIVFPLYSCTIIVSYRTRKIIESKFFRICLNAFIFIISYGFIML